jgi:hypothetical protein
MLCCGQPNSWMRKMWKSYGATPNSAVHDTFTPGVLLDGNQRSERCGLALRNASAALAVRSKHRREVSRLTIRKMLQIYRAQGVERLGFPFGSSVRAGSRQVTTILKTNGGRIWMPRKGLSARRSVSPVTMWVAWPLTASSRNLSSLESRRAVICTSTSTHWASRVRTARKLRVSSSSTYRRNCFLLRTS